MAFARRSLLALVLGTVTMTATPAGAEDTPTRLRSDLPYAMHGGEQLLLDAYLPDDDRVHPAVVLIHGGRWSYGDKDDMAPLAFAMVDRGYAAFSVNYRMLPDFPYPAAVDDLRAAVGWIRTNARELNVDPSRIGAFGGSAGGYLAAALATFGTGQLGAGPRIAAAAAWSAPLDLVPLLVDENPAVPRTITEFLGCGGAPGSCADTARSASPVSHVDETDAPLLIANATGEAIPVEQAFRMAAAYDAVGLPYELITPESTSHGMNNAGQLLEPTMSFLHRWLGEGGGGGEAQGAEPAGSPSPAVVPATPPRDRGVPNVLSGQRGRGAGLIAVLGALVASLVALQLVVAWRIIGSIRRIAASRRSIHGDDIASEPTQDPSRADLVSGGE